MIAHNFFIIEFHQKQGYGQNAKIINELEDIQIHLFWHEKLLNRLIRMILNIIVMKIVNLACAFDGSNIKELWGYWRLRRSFSECDISDTQIVSVLFVLFVKTQFYIDLKQWQTEGHINREVIMN
ncbi:hypothetical protein AB835_04870 [Candidatus Endobugula sertula]|uniref:Uncharacterized protein n=1 Tax=Candidatus Endobugula sertula TaxID=62101 RepID=A0A1D2QRL1_9GAMM|nr:hypothetical protein AB835_04870 [Candidatus Endobugula sertula]